MKTLSIYKRKGFFCFVFLTYEYEERGESEVDMYLKEIHCSKIPKQAAGVLKVVVSEKGKLAV